MAYTFPLMTVVLGAQFPAGLTLYWIATTVFQIVQQYFVTGWGQLPKYLKFLRNIPTPADKELQRGTAELVKEATADLESEASASDDDERAAEGNGRGRRSRGRRRGKR
jgi:YidC/Oxa1 family membrane protein insertase